ncbi:MAG: putative transport system permease protein [Frankiaceae bacterium]|nr:putative transport system permease protein [Frankiaceae bacterium]
MTARWAATYRLSWRLVRRAPGRSVLIAALVAIPVLAGAFAAVTIRTAHLSPDEAASRQLGRADAIAVVTTAKSLTGDVAVGRSNSSGETISNIPYDDSNRPRTGTSWTRRLPPGTRVTPDEWARNARVTVGDRAEEVQGIVLDLADPMTRGIYTLRAGRAPAVGEAALTTKLADRLHVGVGATVDLDGHSVRLAAIVENPNSLTAEDVVASAATYGGLFTHAPIGWYGNVGYWLVDTPATAPDVHDALLADGVVYATRDQWAHPGPALVSDSRVDAQVLIVLGTVAGFGLLEILLLAGAAFAVGTRRQTHELGLLAAAGGDDSDIRRSVLAQGVLLGLGGALVGVAGGVLTVFLLRPELEIFADQRFGALDVGLPDLVAVVVLGVVAGVLAAVVPARAAARRQVLHLLRERYDADGVRTRLPRWSMAAIVGGIVLTIVAAYRWHSGYGGLTNSSVSAGSPGAIADGLVTVLRENRWPAVLWLGSALTLAGLVRACPPIVSGLATLSGRLPLGARLALRDAGRHRHRTAPAVAAVMTVVAGAVLVLLVVSSSDLRDKRNFRPAAPVGTLSLQVYDERPGTADTRLLTAAATRTAAMVGGGSHVVMGSGQFREALLTVQDPTCTSPETDDTATCQFHTVGVATADALHLIVGGPTPAADRALATGGAVVLDRALASQGTVRINTGHPGRRHAHDATLPAVVIPDVPSYGLLPQVYVSPATATAHGWRAHGDVALVRPAQLPSPDQVTRIQHALGDAVTINAERGFQSRYSVALLAMLGAAAIATLAGTSIAVALAMAESRADMATLAAVGASPGRRRVHAMGQAAVVAGLGTGLGVALGALVGLATLGGSALYPTSTPYRWLSGILVVAPALAIVVAGVFTRSRVTLTRRIA